MATRYEMPDRIPPDDPWAQLFTRTTSLCIHNTSVRAVMIENMDENIGRMIQFLKDTGQYDNTLIIFVADNGTQ